MVTCVFPRLKQFEFSLVNNTSSYDIQLKYSLKNLY